MKADMSHQDAHVPDSVLMSSPAHDHAHEHSQGHAHDHAHGTAHRHAAGHEHGTHTHAAPTPLASATSEPRTSLLMSAAPLRLAGAVALSASLWAAVAWALSGTP
jgi:ABC-type Zn2+ transport system substrate-binding protein/surface adhesin